MGMDSSVEAFRSRQGTDKDALVVAGKPLCASLAWHLYLIVPIRNSQVIILCLIHKGNKAQEESGSYKLTCLFCEANANHWTG